MSRTAAAKRPPSYFSSVTTTRRALDLLAMGGMFLLAIPDSTTSTAGSSTCSRV